jgi:FMN phosphatase YigB (HAD superfamily)
MERRQLKAVFFDIGAVLGDITGGRLIPFEWTGQLLLVMRSVLNLRLGIISNLPPNVTQIHLKQLLIGAKLLQVFDPHGLITSVDAKAAKPDPQIFLYAAKQMGLTTSECLYLGAEPEDIEGASVAGMATILINPGFFTRAGA